MMSPFPQKSSYISTHTVWSFEYPPWFFLLRFNPSGDAVKSIFKYIQSSVTFCYFPCSHPRQATNISSLDTASYSFLCRSLNLHLSILCSGQTTGRCFWREVVLDPSSVQNYPVTSCLTQRKVEIFLVSLRPTWSRHRTSSQFLSALATWASSLFLNTQTHSCAGAFALEIFPVWKELSLDILLTIHVLQIFSQWSSYQREPHWPHQQNSQLHCSHTFILSHRPQNTTQPLTQALAHLLCLWYSLLLTNRTCPTRSVMFFCFQFTEVSYMQKILCHISDTQRVSVEWMISVEHLPILEIISLLM